MIIEEIIKEIAEAKKAIENNNLEAIPTGILSRLADIVDSPNFKNVWLIPEAYNLSLKIIDLTKEDNKQCAITLETLYNISKKEIFTTNLGHHYKLSNYAEWLKISDKDPMTRKPINIFDLCRLCFELKYIKDIEQKTAQHLNLKLIKQLSNYIQENSIFILECIKDTMMILGKNYHFSFYTNLLLATGKTNNCQVNRLVVEFFHEHKETLHHKNIKVLTSQGEVNYTTIELLAYNAQNKLLEQAIKATLETHEEKIENITTEALFAAILGEKDNEGRNARKYQNTINILLKHKADINFKLNGKTPLELSGSRPGYLDTIWSIFGSHKIKPYAPQCQSTLQSKKQKKAPKITRMNTIMF